MPKYYKRRRPAKKTGESFDIDWKLILVGVGIFLVYRLFTSEKGTNKGSLLDWIKNLFNPFGFGSGNNPLGNSNNGSDSVFENGDGGENGSGSNGSGLNESKYFQQKEYFGNYPRPTDPTKIANYNRLMKALDRVRGEFGSPILIRYGYNPNDDRAQFRECRAVVIVAQNGANQNLYDLIGTLKKQKIIDIGIVTLMDKEAVTFLIS